LVIHMTQKDPSLRLTADQYLSSQRDKAFPAYFYSFLGLYCQRYAQVPIIHSDDRVARCANVPVCPIEGRIAKRRICSFLAKRPIYKVDYLIFISLQNEI